MPTSAFRRFSSLSRSSLFARMVCFLTETISASSTTPLKTPSTPGIPMPVTPALPRLSAGFRRLCALCACLRALSACLCLLSVPGSTGVGALERRTGAIDGAQRGM
ncbi:hypothetical protein GGX14DRAFT_450235 [Mycena pura]|uniref:Uncharacterized protein n=1 Tax=Mycena pura TaxID=153505 RepID=A0AAD6VEK4_9AGAR|nr:hypothetical protein GGX14DRAFT_450235 [Mycena pura]